MTTFLVVIIKGHSRSEIIGILFKCVVCHIVTLFVKIQRHSSPKKILSSLDIYLMFVMINFMTFKIISTPECLSTQLAVKC